jgi:hypothetical protein
VGEATGDTMAKMLKEIEEGGNLANPYRLSGVEVEQHMAEMRQRIADIRMSIETMWTKSPITEVEKPSVKASEKSSVTEVQKPSIKAVKNL